MSAYIFSLFEGKNLLSLLFLFDILYLLTANSLLELTGACLLVTLCLYEDSLEYLNSLSHASVQRCLDGVEMVV